MHVLKVVRELRLPDCWIGAGFVRNAVWDDLHDLKHPLTASDIDVIFFDPKVPASQEREVEQKLKLAEPTYDWSVTNQAHIHIHNGDDPYKSSIDAIGHWPETATAIATRLTQQDQLEFLTPHGLDDLFELILRPTSLKQHKIKCFFDRTSSREWTTKWPKLKILV